MKGEGSIDISRGQWRATSMPQQRRLLPLLLQPLLLSNAADGLPRLLMLPIRDCHGLVAALCVRPGDY